MLSRLYRIAVFAGAAAVLSVVPVAIALRADQRFAPSPTAPADADADATVLTCADGARQPVEHAGVMINNAWNRASAGTGPWRQCLRSRQHAGRTEYGWSWHWPARDGIYAYPEQLIGRTPWSDLPSNDARFPRSINAIHQLRIEHDVESTSEGKRNLAVEFWLTAPGDAPTPTSIRAELMIWSDASPGLAGDAAPATPVSIDGRDWSVQVHRHWGDASGGSPYTWTFITYRAKKPSSASKYDAKKFLQHAVDQGWLESAWQVEGVELGNEIVSGSGSTWIRHFGVTLD